MPTVTFYRIQKKHNSTARPAPDADHITYQVQLKESSSVIAPVLKIRDENPTRYNYAYIPDFGRYYYVNEWTWSQGFWTASLNVDALASWRAEIGESTQYVVRSAAAVDRSVFDGLYPIKVGVTAVTQEIEQIFEYELDKGTYILGVVNASTNTIGAVTYYAMTSAQFAEFMDYMLGDVANYEIDTEEISENLQKALFNPFQYVVSCMWFPFTISTGTSVSSIPFGWWSAPVSARRLTATAKASVFICAIPKHPEAQVINDYLNLSPYSEYHLYLSPFGTFNLDSTLLADSANILGAIYTDLLTGKAYLFLNTEKGQFLEYRESMVGVPIQIAQINNNPVGVISGIGGAIGGVASAFTGNLGGGISSAINGIMSAAQSAVGSAQTSSAGGSTSVYNLKSRLIAHFRFQTMRSDVHRGQALCQERQLSTIPGYMMISDPEIDLPCTEPETEAIRGFMEGGFYYE